MHPYQKVIREIEASEQKVTGSENAYKLLFKLCRAKGIDMNGNKTAIGKTFGLKEQDVIRLAKETLEHYVETDGLHVPNMFQYRKRKNYTHDGDASANRNLWSKNKKIYTDKKSKKKPPEYTFNTSKK
jgi:hypothetical protein